jgi:hypothetical protein
MDERQQKYVEKSSKRYRVLFSRVFNGRPSLAMRIKAKCVDCVGQEDVCEQVGKCDATVCPLWDVRPFVERPKKRTLTPEQVAACTARFARARAKPKVANPTGDPTVGRGAGAPGHGK